MKRMFLLLAISLLYPINSQAYREGGHHYTVSAVYAKKSPKKIDKYELVTAFCAELPDLSTELDAFTQRTLVVESKHEWGWGLFGTCQTKLSRHMVQTQYYLHDLTGFAPAPKTQINPTRLAARALVGSIYNDFQKEKDSGKKLNLACQLGFAAHLLGDSHAHARLDGSGIYYETGLGHASLIGDSNLPDYMLTRYNDKKASIAADDWRVWVAEVNQQLGAQNTTLTDLLDIASKLIQSGRSPKDLEGPFQNALAKQAGSWEPYSSRDKNGKDNYLDSNIWNQGPGSALPIAHNLCQTQLDRAQGIWLAMPGTPLTSNDKIDCKAVWSGYLTRAIKVFAENGADIASSHEHVGQSCTVPASVDLSDGVEND